MQDPYAVLNVPRSADQARIKRAYRELAKTLHPDRNPGDAVAERRFKEISQAYRLLSDPKQRARFDRGDIDGQGNPRRRFDFGFGGDGDGRGGMESILERVFRSQFGRSFVGSFAGSGAPGASDDLLRSRARANRAEGARVRQRGADRRVRLEVDFLTAARGGKARVDLPEGRTLEIDLPVGAEDGKVLRLRRQGDPGTFGGLPGDLLIELGVRPHDRLGRKGHDIHLDLPVSVPEALFGASVMVPTIDGRVRILVPPRSNAGQILRLRGRGAIKPHGGRGDQLVRLVVMLPEPPDPGLESWARTHGYETRRDGEPE
jgi:DnaJ-class molecular chaperone